MLAALLITLAASGALLGARRNRTAVSAGSLHERRTDSLAPVPRARTGLEDDRRDLRLGLKVALLFVVALVLVVFVVVVFLRTAIYWGD